MNQETKNDELVVFIADVKKMTDAELEASLKELRELTAQTQQEKPQPLFRRRAA